MTQNFNLVTISARINPRTLCLARAAAELRMTTLSRFIAEAVETVVRHELMGGSEAAESEQSVPVL